MQPNRCSKWVYFIYFNKYNHCLVEWWVYKAHVCYTRDLGSCSMPRFQGVYTKKETETEWSHREITFKSKISCDQSGVYKVECALMVLTLMLWLIILDT